MTEYAVQLADLESFRYSDFAIQSGQRIFRDDPTTLRYWLELNTPHGRVMYGKHRCPRGKTEKSHRDVATWRATQISHATVGLSYLPRFLRLHCAWAITLVTTIQNHSRLHLENPTLLRHTTIRYDGLLVASFTAEPAAVLPSRAASGASTADIRGALP